MSLYVAGGTNGSNGLIAYSYDGNTWNASSNSSTIFTSGYVSGMASSSNILVAVGTNGKIAYSTNGTTWNAATATTNASGFASVSYGNGLFIAIGGAHAGIMWYSSDGITWTNITLTGSSINSVFNPKSIKYVSSQNIWIVLSSNVTSGSTVPIGYSTVSITTSNIATTGSWSGMGYGYWFYANPGYLYGIDYIASGTKYVVVGSVGTAGYISYATKSADPNGPNSNYTAAINNGNAAFTDVKSNGTQFVAVGTGTDSTYYSTNGTSWTAASSSIVNAVNNYCVNYGNGMWFIGGAVTSNRCIYTSTDGNTWTAATSHPFGSSAGATVYSIVPAGFTAPLMFQPSAAGLTAAAPAGLIMAVNGASYTSSSTITDEITGTSWNMTGASQNATRGTIVLSNGQIVYNNGGAGPSTFNTTVNTQVIFYYRLGSVTNGSVLFSTGRNSTTANNESLFFENNYWDYTDNYNISYNFNTSLTGTTGWVMRAFVKNGNVGTSYLNGQPDGTYTSSGTTTIVNQAICIGEDYRERLLNGGTANNPLNGEVGWAGIWNVALTSAQILALWNTFQNTLPKPWGAYIANYSNSTTLYDFTGNGRHATIGGIGARLTSGSGKGAVAKIPYITGTTGTTITWPVGSIPTTFTICSITAPITTDFGRIFDGSGANWLHGHDGNAPTSAGVAVYGQFNAPYPGQSFIKPQTNWLVMCGTNYTGASTPNNVLANGVAIGTASGGVGGIQLTINNGLYTAGTTSPTRSNFAFQQVIIWDQALTASQMLQVSNLLTSYLATGQINYSWYPNPSISTTVPKYVIGGSRQTSGNNGYLGYSYDGQTYYQSLNANSVFSPTPRGVANNGTMWVAISAGIVSSSSILAYSYDGITWFPSANGNSIISSSGFGVEYANSMWVAVGSGNYQIAYSYDGITWTGAASSTFFGTSSYGESVVYRNNTWVATGFFGTNQAKIAYSANGINWTLISDTTLNDWVQSIDWNGTRWVAVGKNSAGTAQIIYSTTLTGTWTSPSGTSTIFGSGGAGRSVIWNGSYFLAVGGNGYIVKSSDGITWSSITQAGLTVNVALFWTGTFWLLGGSYANGYGTILYSTDNGATWTPTTTNPGGITTSSYSPVFSLTVPSNTPSSPVYNINNTNLLYYYPFDANFFNYKNSYTPYGVSDAVSTSLVSISNSTTKLTNGSLLLPGVSNETFQVPNTTFTTNGITFSVWMKCNVAPLYSHRIIDFGGGAGVNNIVIWFNDSSGTLAVSVVSPSIGTVNTYATGYVLTDLNWHHYCLTFESIGTAQMYVDGIKQSLNATVYPNLSNLTSCFLGKSNWSSDLSSFGGINANFNQFTVFNRTLSATERSYLFNYPTQIQFSSSSTGLIGSPSYNINNSNLLIYYPFDGDSSNYATGSGVSDATTPLSISTTATKLSNGAMYFPGTDQTTKVKAVNTTFTTNGITFSLWFKNVGSIPGGNNSLFDFGLGANNNGNIMFFFTGSPNGSLAMVAYSPLSSTTGNITNAQSGFTLSDNNWHHYVLTISSGGIWTPWVDGVQYSSPSWTVVPSTSQRTFCQIGTNNFGNPPLNGYMNQFLCFNRVLTASEIRLLTYYPSQITFTSTITSTFALPATATYNINDTGLLQYYKFDSDYVNYYNGTGVMDASYTNTTISTTTTKLTNGSLLTTGASNSTFITSNLTLAAGGVTFAFWMKVVTLQPSTLTYIMDYGNGSNNRNILLGLSAGSLMMNYFQNTSQTGYGTTTYALSDTNWHHYCLIITATTWLMYVDGVNYSITCPVSNLNLFGQYPSTTTFTSCYIGGNHFGNNYVNADYNQLLVFNRTLTATEIAYLANYPSQVGFTSAITSPTALPYNINNAGLLQYYPFNSDTLDYSSGAGVSNGTLNLTSIYAANTKLSNGSLYYPGSTSQYFKASNPSLITTGGMTFAIWAKYTRIPPFNNSYSFRLFDYSTAANTSGILFYYYNYDAGFLTQNNLSLYLGVGSNYFSTFSLQDTNWHHYCATISPNNTPSGYFTVNMYVDGTNVMSQTVTSSNYPTISTSLASCFIGQSNYTGEQTTANQPINYFNQAVVFNRVLSVAEISTLVNAPSQVQFTSSASVTYVPTYNSITNGDFSKFTVGGVSALSNAGLTDYRLGSTTSTQTFNGLYGWNFDSSGTQTGGTSVIGIGNHAYLQSGAMTNPQQYSLLTQQNGAAGMILNMTQQVYFTAGAHKLQYLVAVRPSPSYFTTQTLTVKIFNGILTSSPTLTTSSTSFTTIQNNFTITNAGNYTLMFTFQNTASNDSSIILSNVQLDVFPDYPCFLEGTQILRLDPDYDIEEYVPVETLRPGDLIRTVCSGYKAIQLIGKKVIDNLPDSDVKNRLFAFKKSGFSNENQTEDLVVTGEHCTLHKSLTPEKLAQVRDHMGDIYVTEGYYRVPAHLDERAKPYPTKGDATIWHFALEHHDIHWNYGVFANGLLVESCSVRNMFEYSGMEFV